jgi:hypothetical protein
MAAYLTFVLRTVVTAYLTCVLHTVMTPYLVVTAYLTFILRSVIAAYPNFVVLGDSITHIRSRDWCQRVSPLNQDINCGMSHVCFRDRLLQHISRLFCRP